MLDDLKTEWIKLPTRLEIASNKSAYILQLLLEYYKKLEYGFSYIRAEELYMGKILWAMEWKETCIANVKALEWNVEHLRHHEIIPSGIAVIWKQDT